MKRRKSEARSGGWNKQLGLVKEKTPTTCLHRSLKKSIDLLHTMEIAVGVAQVLYKAGVTGVKHALDNTSAQVGSEIFFGPFAFGQLN